MALTEILRSMSILFVFVVPATSHRAGKDCDRIPFSSSITPFKSIFTEISEYISALYFTGFLVNNNQPVDVTSFAKQVRDHSFSTFAKCTA